MPSIPRKSSHSSVPLGEVFIFEILLIKKGITAPEYVKQMRAMSSASHNEDGSNLIGVNGGAHFLKSTLSSMLRIIQKTMDGKDIVTPLSRFPRWLPIRRPSKFSWMEIRLVSCTVILLISLVVTNARTMEPVSGDKSVSSACDKCLLISRKAETTLKDSKLFDEAHKLSAEVCNVFPTIIQDKCLKKSEAYKHEARLVLQEFFAESHLCYGLRLCAKSEPPVANSPLMDGTTDELGNNSVCGECKRAFSVLLYRLKHRKTRKKIVDAIKDYCEEQDHEDRCKRAVFRYGPVILQHLERFNASELCSRLEMCGVEKIAMKLF